MLFYRVEDAKRVGPYQHEVLVNMADDGLFNYRDHPAPYDDRAFYAKWGGHPAYVFGFTSMGGARWWWDRGAKELEMLHDAGFMLAVYDADPGDVIESWCQAVAILDTADRVEVLDLRTCFKSTREG